MRVVFSRVAYTFFSIFFTNKFFRDRGLMICKKCGREYEDDMPKCLWCDTPNDNFAPNNNEISNSPDSPQQQHKENKPTEKSEPNTTGFTPSENVRRGQSAIFWLKISIVFLVVFFIPSEISIRLLSNFADVIKESKSIPAEVSLSFLFVFLCFIPLSICSCIYIYKACAWFYYAEKNLRQFTKTKFTPLLAVFYTATCVLDYFIYKDILHHQKEVLQKNDLKFSTVSNKALIAILTLSCVYFIFMFVDTIFIIRLLSLILIFPLAICHIKAMRAIIGNEQQLDTKLFNDMINCKVEERIVQRNRE